MSRAPSLLLITLLVAAPAAAQVTDRQVRTAIERGVKHLRNQQLRDGHWPDYGGFDGGQTAVSLLALLTAGVPPNDPAVMRGTAAMLSTKNEKTYTVALKAMVLAMVDSKAYRAEIQGCVDDLCRWQHDDGTWGYGSGGRFTRTGDNSNTQFALLGLYEAQKAGAKVNAAAFDRSDRWFRKTMASDGAWRYSGHVGQKMGSMTAAAVASLHITGGNAFRSQEKGFADGAAPNCGKYFQDVHILSGLEWLGRNFSVHLPPGGNLVQLYYWYYAFERVGVLTGQRYFGDHDWYKEGATRLVMMQQGDGSWPGYVFNTCFAVLFLAKGRLPVLINKVRWEGAWNLDQDDIKNLCAFASANKVFTDPVGWQVVSMDAPVTQWLEAPLLYFNGHTFPTLTDEQGKRLRKYLEFGGTLFVEACCSRPEFDAGFRAFCKKHLSEFTLGKLDASHPVYHSHYEFGTNPPPLFGMDLACRTSIIYSPRDVSCLWQQAALDDPVLKDQTTRAFQIGSNIAAYAAGREPLRDKLAAVELIEHRHAPDEPAIRGAVHLAQIQHTGDWRPDPHALPNLAKLLRDEAGVDVVGRPEPLTLSDKNLFNHPILFLTGHHRFEFTAKEKAELKRYLDRGGFLFAESCCGRKAFDECFRELIKEVFPAAALKAMPADHALFAPSAAGGLGFDIARIRYKRAVRDANPTLDRPVLEMIEIEGRPAVIYSRYSLGCSIDGHPCGSCLGVEKDDAKRMAVNIILFALTK